MEGYDTRLTDGSDMMHIKELTLYELHMNISTDES